MEVLCALAFSALIFGANGAFIPNPDETALMARYIMHNSEWISIATISSLDGVKGYPFVNLKSVSDGPVSNGTGMPYLLMNDMDLSGKDVLLDNRITIMASLADSYCKAEGYDAQDPRCGRLLITGKLIKVDLDSEEYLFAKNALFTRHPVMKVWVLVHKFYITKMDIEKIGLLDQFGGCKFIGVDEYFKANLNKLNEYSEISVALNKT